LLVERLLSSIKKKTIKAWKRACTHKIVIEDLSVNFKSSSEV